MCDSLSLWPLEGCGYGGYCDNSTGLCICKESFVDIGNFQLLPGQHCNIPVKLKNILSLLCFALSVLLSLGRLFGLQYDIKQYFKKRTSLKLARIKLVVFTFLMSDTMAIVLSYLYVYFPERNVGEDLLISVVQAINGVNYWFQVLFTSFFFIDVAVKVGMSSDRKQKEIEMLKLKQKATINICFVLLNLFFIPTFGLYFLGPSWSNFFSIWHAFGMFVLMLVADCIIIRPIANALRLGVVESLEAGMKLGSNDYAEKRMSSLKNNVETSEREVRKILYQNILFFSLVLFWPFLRSFFPVSSTFLSYYVNLHLHLHLHYSST